jgi:hypothetical protein
MPSLYFDWDVCAKCLHSMKAHMIGPDAISFMCVIINMTKHEQCPCTFVVDADEAQRRINEAYP